jgi:endo-1,4-beta-mannosidase
MFQPGAPFVLGVNYWPRSTAMGMWKGELRTAEIAHDFRQMNELGMRLVRIFLLWEDFQPSPTTVACMDKLNTVADLAVAAGLRLDVTFFTGHMSGPSWIPEWMLLPGEPMPPGVLQVVSGGRLVNCGHRNPYTDEMCLAAEERLLEAVVGALCTRSDGAVAMWNLANEPDLVAIPSPAEAEAWVGRMARCIRQVDPTTPITVGLHAPALREHVGFRANVFSRFDLVPVMHGYPMYAAGWAESPLDASFVPGLCRMVSRLNGDNRGTLAEEFGGCTVPGPSRTIEFSSYGNTRRQFMAGEEEFAAYLKSVLSHLHAGGCTGALLWCWADYDPSLFDAPPLLESVHERFFGIVRSDGSLKPHAQVIRDFAETRPLILPCVAEAIDPETYYADVAGSSQKLIKM